MTNLEQASPLAGLTVDEYTKLLLSVGHTSKARRPLSPVEVGELLARSKSLGMSVPAMTPYLKMTDTSMPAKFIRLTELDDSIQYLVAWGASGQKALGFSVANQMSRIASTYHSIFVERCLQHGISKDEAMSVIQLFERSGQTLENCFERVVARRPTIKTLEVIIGSIGVPKLIEILSAMSQLERDELFKRAITQAYPDAVKFSAKLSPKRFTIIGGKSVGQIISRDEIFSQRLNDCLIFLVEKEGT